MAVSGPRDVGRRLDRRAGAVAGRSSSGAARARGAPVPAPARGSEFLHFALRNWKFVARRGPRPRAARGSRSSARCSPTTQPLEFSGPTDAPPSSDYWFGTTSFGQDVFAQFVHGLRAAFLVGAVGGGHRVAARRGRRVHRRLPGRLDRRRPEHAHERRPRDPDARDPDHRRRVPQRAQLHDRGDPHRADLVAVGGAGRARADVLPEDAGLRRHRAAERPRAPARSSRPRSRRT